MERRLLLTSFLAASLAASAAAQSPAPAAPAPSDVVPPSLVKGSPKLPPAVRVRLVELLQLPKEKLWAELQRWPAFQQMTLQEQAAFLQRLAEMRQRLRSQALRKAGELGLKLTPAQEEAFVASYLRERLEVERQMAQDAQAKRHKLEEQMTADLRREYGGGDGKAPASPPTAPAATSPR